MPEYARDKRPEICRQLEDLLAQQHEALLRDELQGVEDKVTEIARVVAGLSDEQKRQVASDMEAIRKKHEQMIVLLSSRKEAVSAQLAAARQKQNLNRSYRAGHE